MTELVIPEDGMQISCDTTLRPGVYFLPSGIDIVADNVTLDGNGALLIGDRFTGQGVRVNQRIGVTIKNLYAERYYHGLWVNAGANIRIDHCHITRTHELPAPDTFLDVWLSRKEAYGGGIFLSGVIDSFVTDNDVQHQQSGIMLYGCNRVEIARNNTSYNSGYGILLFESSENTVEDNIADYCSRMYASNPASDKYHNGADAAALVMMCSSSKNTVRNNKLRSSGDGVFLGGFHKDQIKVPCNDNLFENNDGSNSPNIAFEATFSQHNVFRNNRADNCNFGFWLGYSSETAVVGNSIKGNREAGVAIEHGHHNAIAGNTIERNGMGVQLWVNSNERRAAGLFTQFYPDSAHSHETTLSDNTFNHNDIAVHAWTERHSTKNDASLHSASSFAQEAFPRIRCHHITIKDNTFTDNRVGVLFERVRDSAISGNTFAANLEAGIKLIGTADVATGGNEMG
jgi:parallel beta-helix repeat protein